MFYSKHLITKTMLLIVNPCKHFTLTFKLTFHLKHFTLIFTHLFIQYLLSTSARYSCRLLAYRSCPSPGSIYSSIFHFNIHINYFHMLQFNGFHSVVPERAAGVAASGNLLAMQIIRPPPHSGDGANNPIF